MQMKVQNTGSDQFLIFFPSNGPNGSMLNAPKIELAMSHKNTIWPRIPQSPINTNAGIAINHNTRFESGPASAIIPFCFRLTLPATITAPGAMNKKPMKNAMATPVFKPAGSALNSAQQP